MSDPTLQQERTLAADPRADSGPITHDPPGCPTAHGMLLVQRAREAAAVRTRAENEARAERENARDRATLAERARRQAAEESA